MSVTAREPQNRMSTPANPAAGAATESAAYDPVALAESLASAAEKSAKLIGDFAQRQSASGHTLMADELGIGKAFLELAAQMMSNPLRLAESQMNLWWDYMSLWQSSLLRMMGAPTGPVATPAKGDKRFKHEDWEQHFLFDYIKQSYLITARWLHDQVANVEGLDEKTKKKVDFYTRQYIDAFSPSNFALTNPEVFRATVASGGQNLVKGLNNLLDDIERGNGRLRISMTDPKAFELGVNIATTPGKVVFRNELMELIQYEASTEKVWKRPLVIVPPWINKFYILDLREKNSFIKWCVDQGMTTFVVSWVNPDAKLADAGFERYLIDGTMAAVDAIENATGEPDLNIVGYCLGGTLTAATLGYMAAKKDKRIASATFMTSLIDFRETGELEVFIDEEQVASLERKMNVVAISLPSR
jgi:polyhydroxyalkanoate synthase subunit PhaC